MATCIARLPPSPSLPLLPRRQMATMKAGFGSDKTSSSSSAPKGWTRIADLSEIPTARRTLPVEVSSVLSVMLYLTPSGRLFCTDANSTAFKFPLTDAIIAEDDAQTTIEVRAGLDRIRSDRIGSHRIAGQSSPCLALSSSRAHAGAAGRNHLRSGDGRGHFVVPAKHPAALRPGQAQGERIARAAQGLSGQSRSGRRHFCRL